MSSISPFREDVEAEEQRPIGADSFREQEAEPEEWAEPGQWAELAYTPELEERAELEEKPKLEERGELEEWAEFEGWPEIDEVTSREVRAGRVEVARVPLLASHRGNRPDLILRWNDMPSVPEAIDVVVHLHGFWYGGMKLDRDIEPVSGLDLAPIAGAAGQGRTRPTLTVLPRAHDTGRKQKLKQKDGSYRDGYNILTFPALVAKDGLPELVRLSLDRFAAEVGGTRPRLGRLILTAHSGGGKALLEILRYHDPHQVHVFDALYWPPEPLVEWARRRIRRDRAAVQPSMHDGALRVFYQDRTRGGARPQSLALRDALATELQGGLAASYRVEASKYDHFQIPRQHGWRVLANASADVPGAYVERTGGGREFEEEAPPVNDLPEPISEARQDQQAGLDEAWELWSEADEFEEFEEWGESGEVEEGEAAFFDDLAEIASEEESAETVAFPSGATLRVVMGPTGRGEEHHDPNGTGNPLLDTSASVRSTPLSTSFTVGELASSGGKTFDKARIDPALIRALQILRDHVGKPVRVTSGYRPYLYNVDLYSKRKQKPTLSRHSSGQAADVKIAGMTGMDIARTAIDVLGPEIAVGIGVDYAHVDVRGQWARWTYIKNAAQAARAIAEIDAHRRRLIGGGS